MDRQPARHQRGVAWRQRQRRIQRGAQVEPGAGVGGVGRQRPLVAETRVDIPVASVSDAVMLLDLRNTNALMFRNSASQAYNMVYRRGDGTIGWVEPERGAT